VRNRAAWIAGALGAAGVAYRALRRQPKPAADPRADELRRKLEDDPAPTGALHEAHSALALLIGAAFAWSVRSGQFDDLEAPAQRVLLDDDTVA